MYFRDLSNLFLRTGGTPYFTPCRRKTNRPERGKDAKEAGQMKKVDRRFFCGGIQEKEIR